MRSRGRSRSQAPCSQPPPSVPRTRSLASSSSLAPPRSARCSSSCFRASWHTQHRSCRMHQRWRHSGHVSLPPASPSADAPLRRAGSLYSCDWRCRVQHSRVRDRGTRGGPCWTRARRAAAARTWVLAGTVFAVAAAMLLWRAGLPGQLGTVSPRPATFDRVPLALSSTTMVLLPAALIALARRRRRWHRLDILIGANVGLVLLLPRLLDAATNVYLPDSVMENLTTRWGVPWPDYILGGRPVLIADAEWWLLNLLALVSTPVVTTVAAATLGEHLRRMRPRPLTRILPAARLCTWRLTSCTAPWSRLGSSCTRSSFPSTIAISGL